MARIRSIKPEFWRDEKIADLPNPLAALFFIGLWNFADDEGKFSYSPRALALQMPIFRTREIAVYLRDLTQRGLVQVSEGSQWGLITNWKHQKIDRPIPAKVKNSDIRWLTPCDSSNDLGHSSRTRRKDRIGSDRKGSDRIVLQKTESETGSEPAPRTPPEPVSEPELLPREAGYAGEGGTPASRSIGEFIVRWGIRYNSKYPLTGKDAKLIQGLAKSLGEQRLLQIFDAYFAMPDAWITGRRHDIVTLNSNLSKVAAFADTGDFTTQTQLKQFDRAAATMSQIERIRKGQV